MTHIARPTAIGALMGIMILWMLHRALTGQSTIAGPALAVFVGAHVLIVMLVLASSILIASRSPKLSVWMRRIHTPRLSHLLSMVAGAVCAAGAIHLYLHGIA